MNILKDDTALDRTFTALGDPARRDLLRRIARRPQTAGALAEPFEISRPAISRHLRVLREAGLVKVEVNGREHWYHLDHRSLDKAQTWLEEMRSMWQDALVSLKNFVEEEQST